MQCPLDRQCQQTAALVLAVGDNLLVATGEQVLESLAQVGNLIGAAAENDVAEQVVFFQLSGDLHDFWTYLLQQLDTQLRCCLQFA